MATVAVEPGIRGVGPLNAQRDVRRGNHLDRLNYNQLYYFYVVATEGSVKAACQKLHVSQPTVSGQVRQFENDLGYDLFVRKHRKLELNTKGKALLQKAEKIFRLGDEIVRSLRTTKESAREVLSLGVLQTLPSNFLHDFTIKAWSDPKTKIQVVHGTHKELLNRLNNDEVDLILSDTPLGRSSRVYRSVHLGQQPLIVVGSKKFSGLRKDFPYSLDGSPCLSMGFSGQVQSELEYFFKINNIQPDFIGQIDDLSLMQIAAENSYCVSILPERVAKRSLKNPKMLKIGEISEVSLHFWLITTQLGGKKILIRKLVNQFIKRKKDL